MIISAATEARIVGLMERGAKLWFRIHHIGPDGYCITGEITLEHNGCELRLSEDSPLWFEHFYCDRRDETYFCNPNGRDLSGRALADRLTQRPDIRSEYAGYRSDYDESWRELYVHISAPVPRVISEWWNAELQNQYNEFN